MQEKKRFLEFGESKGSEGSRKVRSIGKSSSRGVSRCCRSVLYYWPQRRIPHAQLSPKDASETGAENDQLTGWPFSKANSISLRNMREATSESPPS